MFVASTLKVAPAGISRVTFTFARVGCASASSGAASVITNPLICFVKVSVRTALFPTVSVAVMVIVCAPLERAVKSCPVTFIVFSSPSVGV